MSAQDLIAKHNLVPHPEGGWYREVFRSSASVQTPRGPRSALTTIYYMLQLNQLSRWHVVESDEIWHFYTGEPLELLAYRPDSRALQRHVLAQSEPVAVIAAGEWQAARSLGEYSLVGCSVGPGFDFADFKFVSALPGHASHFVGAMAAFTGLL